MKPKQSTKVGLVASPMAISCLGPIAAPILAHQHSRPIILLSHARCILRGRPRQAVSHALAQAGFSFPSSTHKAHPWRMLLIPNSSPRTIAFSWLIFGQLTARRDVPSHFPSFPHGTCTACSLPCETGRLRL